MDHQFEGTEPLRSSLRRGAVVDVSCHHATVAEDHREWAVSRAQSAPHPRRRPPDTGVGPESMRARLGRIMAFSPTLFNSNISLDQN